MPNDTRATRRQVLIAGAAAWCAGSLDVVAAQSPAAPDCPLGLASNVFDVRRAAESAGGKPAAIADPMAFLKECHRLGAAGIQGPLGVRDEAYTRQLREFAEARGLYVETSIPLPQDDSAVDQFEKEIQTAKAAGATLARTVIFPGRRYEQFNSADEFAQATTHAYAAVERAEPIARRHHFRLAIENHKDQRIDERIALLKRIGSDFVGACVDIGNSFALCEDPLEVARAYAPFAWTAHIKDQALKEYEDGFLFADAPLGKGFLDVDSIVRILRASNPQIRLNLEVMTRDPLRVPVLTSKYWATMPHVPAADLARTLQKVRMDSSPQPLLRISALPPAQQLDAEARNITDSLEYARLRWRA